MKLLGDRTPAIEVKRPRSLAIEGGRPISKGVNATQTARFPAIDNILSTWDAIVDPKGPLEQS